MTAQLSERVDELTRSRVPFVQATVVRAQEPSSAHAGDRAIVLADGTIEGFVGGQCAAGSVRTAALRAIELHLSNRHVLRSPRPFRLYI